MTTTKLFQLIACRVDSAKNNANVAIASRDHEDIDHLVRDFMPSGSGFDCGTRFELDDSNRLRIVFTTSFHHMDEHGGYAGWTEHKVTITPSFGGFDIKVSGRDRNSIKDHIAETFEHALLQDIHHRWDNDRLCFEFWLQRAS